MATIKRIGPYWIGLEPGDRGLIAGGESTGFDDAIERITITSPANSVDHCNLTLARGSMGACSNGIWNRAVFWCGDNGSQKNNIDYITISSSSDAVGFGNNTVAVDNCAATSNGTSDRGVNAGGMDSSPDSENTITYITISTTPTCTDFGDLTQERRFISALSNNTNDRGVWGGGREYTGSWNTRDTIDYVTISSTGNATDFGNLTANRYGIGGCSNGTSERGLFCGGNEGSNVNKIEYITINSTGNATDLADLTVARSSCGACSNMESDRGVIAGGTTGAGSDVIDYKTISNNSNCTDFGNITEARNRVACASDA